jgi:hypothetical protein
MGEVIVYLVLLYVLYYVINGVVKFFTITPTTNKKFEGNIKFRQSKGKEYKFGRYIETRNKRR